VAVDLKRAGRDRRVRPANCLDDAVRKHDDAVVDLAALAVIDGRAADDRRRARIGMIR
jgi:hypothetical protein